MKRLFLAIAIVFMASTVFAVDPPGTKIPLGLVVGAGKTKTIIDTTELKRIKEIDQKVDASAMWEPEEFDTLNITHKLTAPTKVVGTNTTDVATTAFVQGELAANQYIFTINSDGGAITSPVDATTYYMGSMIAATPTTGTGVRRVYLPKSCTLIGYSCNIFCFTGGTSETYSIYIRKNATTDYSLGSTFESATTATSKYFQANNLSVDFAAGDWFEIKIVTPTWATNPASLIHSFVLYFKTTKI